jgi:predicted helicase
LRLTVNPSLTLATIPPEVFQYRLGNRSVLEWVIDQYQVSTDKRSGITSDPNRADDPEYIRPPRRPGHPREPRNGEAGERAAGGV